MGASNRDRADHMVPSPVWVEPTGHWRLSDVVRPGVLLEWRRTEDQRGRVRWEGLVVWAYGGGELPWRVETSWMHSSYLRAATSGHDETPPPATKANGGEVEPS